ncbi:MAG: hypothetical protein ACRD1E_02835 [Terriglobales bacterium]
MIPTNCWTTRAGQLKRRDLARPGKLTSDAAYQRPITRFSMQSAARQRSLSAPVQGTYIFSSTACSIMARRRSAAMRSVEGGCRRPPKSRSASSNQLQEFADAFCSLQELRLDCDYNPSFSITKASALAAVDAAAEAVGQLNSADVEDKKLFLAFLILGRRPGN